MACALSLDLLEFLPVITAKTCIFGGKRGGLKCAIAVESAGSGAVLVPALPW